MSQSQTSQNEPTPDSRISHTDAVAYWNTQPATDNGVLVGLEVVTRVDIQGSKNFFAKLRGRSALGKRRREEVTVPNGRPAKGQKENGGPQTAASSSEIKEDNESFAIKRAADCGAGIGRVTLNFLSKISETTDIVEPVKKFTDEISEGEGFASLRQEGRIGRIENVGLESWMPEEGVYDLIWNQWCLSQLTDEELIAYLQRAKKGLAEGGWMVAKENVTNNEHDEFDETDSSVARSLANYRRLFKKSGYTIELEETQKGFPKGLFPVKMFGLRPAS